MTITSHDQVLAVFDRYKANTHELSTPALCTFVAAALCIDAETVQQLVEEREALTSCTT